MPKVNEFMQHFINVRDAAYQKKRLYDGCKNRLSHERIKEIYTDLTTKTDVWLNAKILLKKKMAIVTGLGPLNNLKLETEVLKRYKKLNWYTKFDWSAGFNGYVKLDLNSQGFPKPNAKKASREDFEKLTKNEIIYYRGLRSREIFSFIGEEKRINLSGYASGYKLDMFDIDYESKGVLPCIDL